MSDTANRAKMPTSINGTRYANFKEALRAVGLLPFFTDRERRAFRKELREKGRLVRKIDGTKYRFRALAS